MLQPQTRLHFLAAGAAAAAAALPLPAFSQTTPLRVILFFGASTWPLWIAQSKGFYAREHLSVQITNTPNSAYMYEHMNAGDFDIAHSAVDNIFAVDEGQGEVASATDFFAFMGVDNGFLRLYARPEIRSYADLRGKAVAVDALTTGYAFVLRKMLEKNGLSDTDYRLVAAGGTPGRAQKLQSDGDFVATLVTPPFDAQLKAKGYTLLGNATDVIGRYQGITGNTRRSWAQAHQDVLVGYIRAFVAALGWLYDPKNRDEAIAIYVDAAKVTPDIAAQTYAAAVEPAGGLFPRARIDVEGLRTTLALRSQYAKPQKTLTDPLKYIDESYYRRAVGG
ncbi:MAG: ABC transporter substrate-binding protein [Candidatus Velthaea sp.]